MRVLVTGASGFVGRALCAALSRAGHEVMRGSRRGDASAGSVGTGELGPDCSWFDRIDCPEVIVHLAARVHQMDEDPSQADELHRIANTEGTLALARCAAARGVRRFVFLSSVKVNGEGRAAPYRADDAAAPVDAYGRAKAAAEAGLFELAGQCAMQVVVIRPPLVHGPGVAGNLLSLMRWLQRGVPLPLAAVTHNRRSLVGIDNLVSLITLCLTHDAAPGRVWMVSDGEDVSTAGLLRRLASALGVPGRLWPVPVALLRGAAALAGRRAMMQRLCGDLTVDIEATRRLLGWRPPLTLDEGLRRCAQAFLQDRPR